MRKSASGAESKGAKRAGGASPTKRASSARPTTSRIAKSSPAPEPVVPAEPVRPKMGGTPFRIALVLGALLLVLIAVVAVLALQTSRLASRLETRNEAVLSAVRDNTATLEFLKENLTLLADDSNAARTELNLPVRHYPILNPPPADAPATDESTDDYLEGFDALLQVRDRQIQQQRFSEVASSPVLSDAVRTFGFTVDRSEQDQIALLLNGTVYFVLRVDPATRNVEVRGTNGKSLTVHDLDNRFRDFIAHEIPEVRAHLAELDASIATLNAIRSNPQVQAFMQGHALVFGKPIDSPGAYQLEVDLRGTAVMTVLLDKDTLGARVGEHKYPSASALSKSFPTLLASLDLRTPDERRVDEARKKIESLKDDRTFAAALASKRIRLATNPREDADYYYYDFTDVDGNRLGSFAVQKEGGNIYLMDSQDVPISGLQTVGLESPSAQKKKNSGGAVSVANVDASGSAVPRTTSLAAPDPIPLGTDAADFLLCGAHQGDTDTIMIVHIDQRAGNVTFISIPRDLYYKGRKINAVYRLYGPAELANEISQITGIKLTHYVVIDMYAFIDVVNILGGIDLYLPDKLEDPTYRVRDNGVWSTLSYAKGWHHLDGIETLRIARSRHTTSDFARAYRQQDVLVAIRRKIDDMDLSNVGKLYNLIQAFYRYVDTNFDTAELIDLFRRDVNLPVTGHYVIDTQNVLYQSYTNTYYLSQSGGAPSNEGDPGEWIVLPKDNNWNLIRQYVRSITEGASS